MRRIEIEVGYIPPKEVQGNSRAHHMAKYRVNKKVKLSGHDNLMCSDWDRKPFEKVKITYHFSHPNLYDIDNLAIGMKGFVDGMVRDAGLTVDDNPLHVVYGEHTFKRGDEKTIIRIEEELK